jgi:hypothetical protein
MAHFAELDDNNTVLRVMVVNDGDTADEDGSEVESVGQQYLADLFGGTWVQTSFSGSMRRRFASVGSIYDPDLDIFLNPKPFPSWSLDENYVWQPPTPRPDDGNQYDWDEDTTSWIEVTE